MIDIVLKNKRTYDFVKKVVEYNGNVRTVGCATIDCNYCPFTLANGLCIASKDSEKLLKIANEYLCNNKDPNTGDLVCVSSWIGLTPLPITVNKIYNIVEELDTKYLIIDDNGERHYISKNLFEEINIEKEEVKKMSIGSLKEKILAKIDYRAIAEEVFNRLEKDIIDEIEFNIDEEQIAIDFIDGYKSDFIDEAKQIIEEEIHEDIDYSDVMEEFKEVVRDEIING